MIAAKPVSLNLNLRGVVQPATLATNEHSRLLREQSRTAYAMGLGKFPFPLPDSVVEALRLAASEKIPLEEQLPDCFTQRYCGGVLVGIERLVEWVGRKA